MYLNALIFCAVYRPPADENIKVMKKLHILETVVLSIEKHKTVPTLIKNGLLTLAALVAADGQWTTLGGFH